MTIDQKKITRGFVIAGVMNLTVLLFSRFFTNTAIPEFDPVVMSNFGLLMIVIWGLAYISVAKQYQKVIWLVVVFAIEKAIYGVVWIEWLLNHSLSEVFDKDLMAGMFYSVYGINDWFFFGFFLFVLIREKSKAD